MSDPASTTGGTAPKKWRPSLRLIAVMLGVVVALVIVLQNTEAVDTRLLFVTITMPRAVLLLITFLLGVIVGLLAAFLRRRPAKK